jgi:hypothetical protein
MNDPVDTRPNATATPAYDAQLASLDRRGHALLRGALPRSEVDGVRDVFRDCVAEIHRGLNPWERSLGASATRASFSLISSPEPIRKFVCSPVLGEVAAHALGVDIVRVLHFNGFFKPAGGMATPWHQDMIYIPLDCDAVVTFWVPLVPVSPDMGSLVFATGSHLEGPIELAGIEDRYGLSTNEAMEPGDISVHHGWTAHRSEPNRSDRAREAIAISYFPDGARVRSGDGGPPMMASLLAQCLFGLKPPDLARGPAVPVVYSKNKP